MSLWRRFDAWTRGVQSRLDLKKRLPRGYVSAWVFRSAVFVAVLFALFVVASESYRTGSVGAALFGAPSLSCPVGGPDCVNTFYVCYTGIAPPGFDVRAGLVCPSDVAVTCGRFPSVCASLYVRAGESVGAVQSGLAHDAELWVLLILAASFPVNHLLFLWRQRRF